MKPARGAARLGLRLRAKFVLAAMLPLVAASTLGAGVALRSMDEADQARERQDHVELTRYLVDLSAELAVESSLAVGIAVAADVGLGPVIDSYREQLGPIQASRTAALDGLAALADELDEVTPDAGAHLALVDAIGELDGARGTILDLLEGGGALDGQAFDAAEPLFASYGELHDTIDSLIQHVLNASGSETQSSVAVLRSAARLEASVFEDAVWTLAPIIRASAGLGGPTTLDIAHISSQSTIQEIELRALDGALHPSLPPAVDAESEDQWAEIRAAVLGWIDGGELPTIDLLTAAGVAEERVKQASELRTALGERLASVAATEARSADDRASSSLLAVAFVLLASVLVMLLLARHVLSRLSIVEGHARRVGAGDLDVEPMDLGGRDEVSVLGRAFDDMTGTLRAVRTGLQLITNPADAVETDCLPPGPIGTQLGAAMRDVSLLHDRTRASEALAHGILEATDEAIWTIDSSGEVVSSNAAAAALLGRPRDDALEGRPVSMLLEHFPALDELPHELRDASTTLQRYGGGQRTVLLSTRLIADASPSVVAVLARDITPIQLLQERLTLEATHDHLTGMANRASLVDSLARAAGRARRRREGYGLIFCDLDRFKTLNDSLGHELGDQVLVEVARRLKGACREGDLVARNGGDEFVVLADEVSSIHDVVERAERMRLALTNPMLLDGQAITISASFGVSWLDPFTDDGGDHLRNADIAMHRAKASGPGQIVVFDNTMRKLLHEQVEIERDLRRALSRGEIEPYIQPIVDIRSGAVVGGELLSRWRHEGQFVPPDQFIPVAEQSTLIVDLGRYVLGRGAELLDQWRTDPSLSELYLSVNISGRHIDHGSCVADVAASIGDWDPARLVIELTETAILADRTRAAEQLERLRSLGVRIAVDDFGIGHASLSYLRELPLDVIKIDRSIVTGVGTQHADTIIVEMLCQLADALHLGVVAEGIEDDATRTRLIDVGCALAQGYHFARPMPVADFTDWARNRLAAPH